MTSWPFLVVAAHFVGAAVLLAMPRRSRRAAVVVALAPMAAAVVMAALAAGAVIDGDPVTADISWLPALGVSLDVRFDALALIFTFAIAAIGMAIITYAAGYFAPEADLRRFLALLVGFAGAMMGIAITDNLFGLFVFWELTTVTSYLLVGFQDEKGSARAAALHAILTTSLGGLAMLGGFVLLFQAAGTATLSEIVASPPSGTTTTVALVLIFLGAFTKSAQAPFHFWLPGAMAAPTPASAYLHSATMVKAGVLLLLRLAPGFAATGVWTPVVLTVGLATMMIGAWRALRQTDLKLILAYGTVSQLGFMTALVGLGSPVMLHAALAVLVAHALFKSTLFLVVGAIDHQAGTRDIRVLSGLGRRLPWLALIAVLAAASMAGVAPLLGFATKEAAVAALLDEHAWIALAVISVASALTATYALRFVFGAFGTKPPSGEVDHVGPEVAAPGPTLWGPPALLGAAGLVFGIVPGAVDAVVSAAAPGGKLVLWPGWNLALGVSIAIIAAGVAIYAAPAALAHLQHRVAARLAALHVPSAEGSYRWLIDMLNRVADRVTGITQNGSLPVYIGVILITTLTVPAAAWIGAGGALPQLPPLGSAAEIALGVFVAVVAIAVLRAKRRLAAVILLGGVGYSIAGVFVLFGAPDLALTLLLVETVTVAVFAFVLGRLPRRFEEQPWRLGRAMRAGVALVVGGFVTAAALVTNGIRTAPPVADVYVELAPDAGGRNVVNVILTDFRALDTLGEITVIAAAAVGIGALVMRTRTQRRTDDVPDTAREAA